MFWSDKVILVTGGAGFIGSALLKKLSELNPKKLISIDDYSSGYKSRHLEGVEYIEGKTEKTEHLISIAPDIIYHLGEYSRVEASFKDCSKVAKSNVNGTQSVLDFWKKTKAKLIYAGSSTKFGDGGLGRSQSPYALTKSQNTEKIISYMNWFQLDGAVSYFYNVYGPGEIKDGTYATVIGIFENQMKKALPLPVVSPGVQKRNFTHIEDIIDGLILVGEFGQGDEYGIGHPKSYSINEVAELFGCPIEMIPPRRGNRIDAKVVTDKLIALGWAPKHSLEDYILGLKQENGDS